MKKDLSIKEFESTQVLKKSKGVQNVTKQSNIEGKNYDKSGINSCDKKRGELKCMVDDRNVNLKPQMNLNK